MSDKKLIFLSGFMSCGKTTHGKKLAKALGYHFIDLDEYTANKYDLSIVDLFKEVGETEFRNIETTSLKECIDGYVKTVIALGGGTPCFNNNIDLLTKNGLLVYLKMDANALYNRVFGLKGDRPLLEDKNDAEMLLYIENLLKVREEFYSQAKLTVYNNNLNEEELLKLVQEKLV